jgi:hypothetical protein
MTISENAGGPARRPLTNRLAERAKASEERLALQRAHGISRALLYDLQRERYSP